MLHYCPVCRRPYDCHPPPKPEEAEKLAPHLREIIMASIAFRSPFGCGTPYEWRCPSCAEKTAALRGEKSQAIYFDYTA